MCAATLAVAVCCKCRKFQYTHSAEQLGVAALSHRTQIVLYIKDVGVRAWVLGSNKISESMQRTKLSSEMIPYGQSIALTNFTPSRFGGCDRNNEIYVNRDVISMQDLEKIRMDKMPGFKLSWWYSGGEVELDPSAIILDEVSAIRGELQTIFVK